MTSKLESWRRAAYNAEECLAGCLASPEIAKHLDQGTARTILERLSQARLEMLAALEATQPAAGEPVAWIIESPEGCSPCKSINHLKHMAERYAAVGWSVTPLYAAPPAAAHGDSLSFSTAQELATAIRQVAAYEDLGPELIAEEMFKQAGAAEAAHGDEAATLVKALSLLWEATNFLPRGGSLDGRVSAFLAQHAPEPVASAAAMRAQGDGEVQ